MLYLTIRIILTCIFFLLPAAFSNMAPVLVKRINILKHPIDFKAKINKKRVLGDNKTFRGLIAGICMAIIIVWIQAYIYQNLPIKSISIINYAEINILLLGFLLGFGAMLGDIVESFFKRQLGIKPGEKLLFFDQTDWVLGALLLSSLYVSISYQIWIYSIIIFFVIHVIVKHVGYYIGLENKKW